MLFPGFAGSAGSSFDELNALVEKCANRKVTKLMAAGGDEAHLFIWVRGSVSDAELAMATLPPPDETPALPPGIDVVWVATVDKLWRLRPPGGWEQSTWDYHQ